MTVNTFFNLVLLRTNELNKDWAQSFSQRDKVKVIKELVIPQLKNEFNQLTSEIEHLEKEQGQITGDLCENIHNLNNEINYSEELNSVKEQFNQILAKISNTKVSLNEKRLNRKILPENKESFNLIEKSNALKQEISLTKRQVVQSKLLDKSYNFTYSHIFSLNQFEEKSCEFIIYNSENDSIKKYELNQSMFVNNTSNFQNFNRGIKYVNLGNRALISGLGLGQKKCYQMLVDTNEEIKIEEFPEMSDGRCFHNNIYIPEREIVLICGGRNNTSAEILNIFLREWIMIAHMKRGRSNGSLAYINNRYVYCISGFEGNKYLNNCEFFDLDNFHKDWVYIDFTVVKVSFDKSAPGVIHLTNNKVLLLGGLIQDNYSDNTYSFFVEGEPEKISLQQELLRLPEGSIFLHNSFCFTGKDNSCKITISASFYISSSKNNFKLV